jgi:hypothetical protein
MSGFVVVHETTGAPVEEGLLRRAVDVAAWRGPDGAAVWVGRGIGGLAVSKRALAFLLVLLAPAADDGLAEAVFAAELGEALLATAPLVNDFHLRLPAEDPLLHRSAPQ